MPVTGHVMVGVTVMFFAVIQYMYIRKACGKCMWGGGSVDTQLLGVPESNHPREGHEIGRAHV